MENQTGLTFAQITALTAEKKLANYKSCLRLDCDGWKPTQPGRQSKLPSWLEVMQILDDGGIDTDFVGSCYPNSEKKCWMLGFLSIEDAELAIEAPLRMGKKTIHLRYPTEEVDYKIEQVSYCTRDRDITRAFEGIQGIKVINVERQKCGRRNQGYVKNEHRHRGEYAPKNRPLGGRVFIRTTHDETFTTMPATVTIIVEGNETEIFEILPAAGWHEPPANNQQRTGEPQNTPAQRQQPRFARTNRPQDSPAQRQPTRSGSVLSRTPQWRNHHEPFSQRKRTSAGRTLSFDPVPLLTSEDFPPIPQPRIQSDAIETPNVSANLQTQPAGTSASPSSPTGTTHNTDSTPASADVEPTESAEIVQSAVDEQDPTNLPAGTSANLSSPTGTSTNVPALVPQTIEQPTETPTITREELATALQNVTSSPIATVDNTNLNPAEKEPVHVDRMPFHTVASEPACDPLNEETTNGGVPSINTIERPNEPGTPLKRPAPFELNNPTPNKSRKGSEDEETIHESQTAGPSRVQAFSPTTQRTSSPTLENSTANSSLATTEINESWTLVERKGKQKKTTAGATPRKVTPINETTTKRTQHTQNEKPKPERIPAKLPNKTNILVCGDSHAVHWARGRNYMPMLYGPTNCAISGMTAPQLAQMIETGKPPPELRFRDGTPRTPKHPWPKDIANFTDIIISIGSNDVTRGETPQTIIPFIREVCEKLKAKAPKAAIHLNSVPPRFDMRKIFELDTKDTINSDRLTEQATQRRANTIGLNTALTLLAETTAASIITPPPDHEYLWLNASDIDIFYKNFYDWQHFTTDTNERTLDHINEHLRLYYYSCN